MDPLKRKSLTADLQLIVSELAADLHAQLREEGPARTRARSLHSEELVADDFDVWLDLLSRRAAVLWVLKTVYVRVLEDRGFVRPVRLGRRESQELFQRIAPALGDTAFLSWVFRDLAAEGGLPELFARQPAELAAPSNQSSKRLIEFWRTEDEATGILKYRFDDEHFDGRLMGDLYQDLDPLVKKRYALAQTPDFVTDFILDETLRPAIATFGAMNVRLIDPSCGSGHFLIEGLKRLVEAASSASPSWSKREVVADCLSRIVGIDLNDYACALARARLIMTGLELAGATELGQASHLSPHVYWADGLDQAEWDDHLVPPPNTHAAPLSRGESRAALRPLLRQRFHVVVGNPPYITEKNATAKAYHREKIGGRARYLSASGRYSLGAVFTERMAQLGTDGAYVGLITTNSFARRLFGAALVESVLRLLDLRTIIDTSGVRIPYHGTATLILFFRRQDRTENPPLLITAKRGDSQAAQPELGPGWLSLIAGNRGEVTDNEYITARRIDRAQLDQHPWPILGAGATEIVGRMDAAPLRLGSIISSAGLDTVTRASPLLELAKESFERRGVEAAALRPYQSGTGVRDWGAVVDCYVPHPYDGSQYLPELRALPGLHRYLWPHRTWLARRFVSGGTRLSDIGMPYWAHPQYPADKHLSPNAIFFAEVATHNHFTVTTDNRLGKALVLKLKPDAEPRLHDVAGILNTAAAEFWMKAQYQPKGGDQAGDGSRVPGEPWEERFQRTASTLRAFPLPENADLFGQFSRLLHRLAHERLRDSAYLAIETFAKSGAAALRAALASRRDRDFRALCEMVWLQEELDWHSYKAFGLLPDSPRHTPRPPAAACPYVPGLRPFEIALAREDATRRAAIAAGNEPEEAPTEWFERHGWSAKTDSIELPESERIVVKERLALTDTSPELRLLEQPAMKRRWYQPNPAVEERRSLELWLVNRIEEWAKNHSSPFTVDEASGALQADPSVLAVCEALTGRADFSLRDTIGQLVLGDSVPNQKHHVFKPSGLTKRSVWERTWQAQRAEDNGDPFRSQLAVNESTPPKYVKTDFLRDAYWTLRDAMDVPLERFTALTEVPGRSPSDTLFVWAGMTPRNRAKAFVELDEQAERAGVSKEDRVGLLHSIQFLADYVAWDSETAANEYRAAVTAVVGQAGVTEGLLAEWAARCPPTQASRSAPKSKRRRTAEESEES
jgi:hypothetical protein